MLSQPSAFLPSHPCHPIKVISTYLTDGSILCLFFHRFPTSGPRIRCHVNCLNRLWFTSLFGYIRPSPDEKLSECYHPLTRKFTRLQICLSQREHKTVFTPVPQTTTAYELSASIIAGHDARYLENTSMLCMHSVTQSRVLCEWPR